MAGSPETSIEKEKQKGRFSIMDKGEAAPFAGVLYDPLGNALILSAKEKAEEEKELALQELREIMEAEFKKEYQLIESRKKAQEEKFRGIIFAQEKQIKELEQEATKKGLPGVVWFGIGAGSGAAATLITILFVAL